MNATPEYALGRIPSPPDGRDYRLENFLHLGADTVDDAATLAAKASAEFKLTTIRYQDWVARTYPDVTATHWWRGFNFLSQIVSPPPPPPSGDVSWADPDPVLDQGQYGTCIGNGGAQWCNTDPVEDHYTEGWGSDPTKGGPYARSLYYETTVLDGSPDVPTEPPDYSGGQQGATPRSLMKALKNRGRLSAYAVTYSVDTVKTWLDQKGSVIFGTNWYKGMFTPDANGYISPTGGLAGGHCYIASDHFRNEGAIGFLNSWGEDWGLGGRCKMKYADVATLLNQQGEAWTAVELPI